MGISTAMLKFVILMAIPHYAMRIVRTRFVGMGIPTVLILKIVMAVIWTAMALQTTHSSATAIAPQGNAATAILTRLLAKSVMVAKAATRTANSAPVQPATKTMIVPLGPAAPVTMAATNFVPKTRKAVSIMLTASSSPILQTAT
jgi:hypothetical protein